jgi:multidrug efflux pump
MPAGIFWVVGMALVISWFVAVVFTPYLGVGAAAEFRAHHDADQIYHTRIYSGLRRVIAWCVAHRVVVVAATALAFSGSVFLFATKVQKQFFPLSDRTELFFQMRLPEGSAIGATFEVAKQGETLLAGDEDAETWTTYVGQGSPRFWLGLNPQLPNEAFAEIVIKARDVKARERLKAKIEKAVSEGQLSEARCASIVSPLARRSAFRCNSASSDPIR